MIVRFSPRATKDLTDIADYIRPQNPAAAQRVRAAILAAVGVLIQFPKAGRLQNVENVRKFVVNRYPYVIYYTLDSDADAIVIVAVQHAARDREFADK